MHIQGNIIRVAKRFETPVLMSVLMSRKSTDLIFAFMSILSPLRSKISQISFLTISVHLGLRQLIDRPSSLYRPGLQII